ncbi:Poorly processive [Nostoc sphaeroides CCNUC1]|uniref:Poorly processive n=1 Tax=Nostoc sphaeroides CCNUC1 TaxID=2653204 RepID=A0A5P8WH80_9NOSO|nr:Poorly processive [Nostoc sphaeroides CCNUC1]
MELTHHFGKAGQYYYKIARAEDDRPVEANRVRKSIGAETSFALLFKGCRSNVART